jgi:hypothetical protein
MSIPSPRYLGRGPALGRQHNGKPPTTDSISSQDIARKVRSAEYPHGTHHHNDGERTAATKVTLVAVSENGYIAQEPRCVRDVTAGKARGARRRVCEGVQGHRTEDQLKETAEKRRGRSQEYKQPCAT